MAFSCQPYLKDFLLKLAQTLYYHRRWFLYPQVALAVGCVLFTVRYLQFNTDRNALVGSEQEYHRHFLELKEEFPVQDDLVVIVEGDDFGKCRQFIERLGARIERDMETNDLFTGLFYKADLRRMGRKALYFTSSNELAELRDTLERYRPVLAEFASCSNLVSLMENINERFRTATRDSAGTTNAFEESLSSLARVLHMARDGLERPGKPPAPSVAGLFEGGAEAESKMYLTVGTNRMVLLTVQASKADLNAEAVERLRQFIRETQMEVPGLNVGLTGEPVLEIDEMLQSQEDTKRATVVSLILVALIFIYGYHETGRPLKATLCLLVGLTYTMGYTTLVIGHLNVLTITFVPILVGLAIDFGVHLITRYEEELRHGASELLALEKAIVNTGTGICTGAMTTAGAFFAMAFTDFRGISEMGLICGGGMLLCLVPMMTLLPVMLLRGQQNILDHELGPELDKLELIESNQRARIERLWLNRPATVVGLTIALTLLAGLSARKVRFDYNLLHMQSEGLPAVIFQQKLIESSDRSLLYCAVVADSVPQATNLAARIEQLPSVAGVETLATYLAEDHTPKLPLIRDIKRLAASVSFPSPDTNCVDLRALQRTLFAFHGYCGLAARQAQAEAPEIARLLGDLQGEAGGILQQLWVRPASEVEPKLRAFQQKLFAEVREVFEALRRQEAEGGLTVADVPSWLRQRFVGRTGKFLLYVYPKKNVWDRVAQEEFIAELRTVDPKVTGTPVQLYEYTSLLKDSFIEAAGYSLAAIALLLFFHFQNLRSILLGLMPVGIGFVWMTGLMGWWEVPYNPANIMTLPLIVGIGVTNGIHILNRFAEEQHPSILGRSTGKAVLVSGLTTIAGFGSLTLAKHQGIQSLGYVMATGTATCMVVGLTFLPALLRLFHRRTEAKKTQRDNAQSALGREEPRSRPQLQRRA